MIALVFSTPLPIKKTAFFCSKLLYEFSSKILAEVVSIDLYVWSNTAEYTSILRASSIGTIYPDLGFALWARTSSVGTETRGIPNAKQSPFAAETPIRNPV